MSFFFTFIRYLCDILTVAVLARALISWFPINPDNAIVAFLNQVTEPLLSPLRRVIPRIGMLDITPMVAIIILQIIASLIP